MLKKRLIGTVIVKDGWAVQSFGYGKYLPLGKPECIVENLDRWGADEILVLSIDRRIKSLGPDLELLSKIAQLGLETPLIYGGGIYKLKDAQDVIQLGADRFCVDALLHDDIDTIRKMSEFLGVQAIIGVLPLSIKKGNLEWLDYRNNKGIELTQEILNRKSDIVSELLVIDWVHEGSSNGFDINLINRLPKINIPLITFGGITENEQICLLLSNHNVAAVAVGNSLSYQEHSIQNLKKHLKELSIRHPYYEQINSLISNV